MTAGAEDEPRCLSVGMDDYLAKPVQKDRLLSTVARWTGLGSSGAAGSPAAPTPTFEEILDPDTTGHLWTLADEPGSEGLLDELFQLFFKEMTLLLADLHAAARRNDSHAVAFTAHTIKGSAAELGVRRLVLACSDLVSMGVAGRLEGIGQALREVEVQYELARHPARSEFARRSRVRRRHGRDSPRQKSEAVPLNGTDRAGALLNIVKVAVRVLP